MTIFDKLFKKKAQDNIGGVEDFMILIRVYYQATIASHIGINNLAALPDLRVLRLAAQNVLATLFAKAILPEQRSDCR